MKELHILAEQIVNKLYSTVVLTKQDKAKLVKEVEAVLYDAYVIGFSSALLPTKRSKNT